jgi:hypothetical protein
MNNKVVKIQFEIYNQDQWYQIIRDLNKLFGRGSWRGQKHVKRKFSRHTAPLHVWFEIPDETVASYVQLKYSGLSVPKIG